jgi:hypothetical protein
MILKQPKNPWSAEGMSLVANKFTCTLLHSSHFLIQSVIKNDSNLNKYNIE